MFALPLLQDQRGSQPVIKRKNIPLFGICVLLLTLLGMLLSMRCDQTTLSGHGLIYPSLHSPLLSIESIIYPHGELFFYGSILGASALSVLLIGWLGYRFSMICGTLAAAAAAAIALHGTADSSALLMSFLTLRIVACMLLLLTTLPVLMRLGARTTAQWRLLLGCMLPLLPLLVLALAQYGIDPLLYASQSELSDSPLQLSCLVLSGIALLGLLGVGSVDRLREKKTLAARGQSIYPTLLLLLIVLCAVPYIALCYEGSTNMMFHTSSYYGKYMSALLPATLILLLLALLLLPIKGARLIRWSLLACVGSFVLAIMLAHVELLGISDGEMYYSVDAAAIPFGLAYTLLYLLIPLLVARVYQTGRHPSVYVGACFVMAMLLGGLF